MSRSMLETSEHADDLKGGLSQISDIQRELGSSNFLDSEERADFWIKLKLSIPGQNK